MPAPIQIAFGKLPKESDSRTILLSLSLSGGLLTRERAPACPVHNEQLVAPQAWGDLGNLRRKDCAVAAAGHAEMLWGAKYGKPLAYPTTAQILDDYSKITGYDGDPATDKGADLLTVLKYWQKTGIAGQMIGAFAEILPPDIETLRWAIDSLGVAYVGLRLSVASAVPKVGGISSDFLASRCWYKPTTWQNPLYGHCVIYTGYGPGKTFTCVSWGKVMEVSERFHKAYCDEAYAILAPEQVEDGAATANPAVQGLKETAQRLTRPGD